MTVKQQVAFVAQDGSEFEAEADALRHDKLIKARAKYEGAKKEFGKVLMESHTTADGQPFQYWGITSYFAIKRQANEIPSLVEVQTYGGTYDFDEEDGLLVTEIRKNGDVLVYRVSDLYKDGQAARVALANERRKWLIAAAQVVMRSEKKSLEQYGLIAPDPSLDHWNVIEGIWEILRQNKGGQL